MPEKRTKAPGGRSGTEDAVYSLVGTETCWGGGQGVVDTRIEERIASPYLQRKVEDIEAGS